MKTVLIFVALVAAVGQSFAGQDEVVRVVPVVELSGDQKLACAATGLALASGFVGWRLAMSKCAQV